jgi:hypothetical protein
MFPKHSAGIRETEIPVTERAASLITAPLLPVGPGRTPESLHDWRLQALDVLVSFRVTSRGRHTTGAPLLPGSDLMWVCNELPADHAAMALYSSVISAWTGGRNWSELEWEAPRTDLPDDFDVNVVKVLALLTANSHAE